VAVVAGTLLAIAMPAWRRALGFGDADHAAYAVGDRVDVPREIYESAPLTLLLFTRADCVACQSAKPTFTSLITRLRHRGALRVAMVVRPGSEREERPYLHDLGLDDTSLVTADFSALRMKRVPTTLLVDQQGIVRYFVEGPPSAVDEAELMRIAAAPPVAR
jgi:hypothetical protein